MTHGCPCKMPDQIDCTRYSAEWYRRHKAHHLEAFPAIARDKGTVDYLEWAIARAEQLEGSDR